MVTRAERVKNLLSAAEDHRQAGQYGQACERLQMALRYASGKQQKTDIQALIDDMPVRRWGGSR